METLLYREALLYQPDVAAGTVRLSFASEAAVTRRDKKHGTYNEVLSHGPGDANLGLLNTQGIVLENHDDQREIGVVIPGSVRVEADGKSRGTVKLTNPVWKKRINDAVANGEHTNIGVSVGYRQISVVRSEQPEGIGIPTLYFAWQPYEISLLDNLPPADPSVGIFRNKNPMNSNLEEILQLALSGSRRMDGTFTREALINDYSLADVLRGDELNGINRSVNDSTRRIGGDAITETFVRFECLMPKHRDLTTDVFASGGAFVQPDLHPFIELMQNKVVAISLGAQAITGLTGDFFDPRVIGVGTSPVQTPIPMVIGQTASAAKVSLQLDQPSVRPRRISLQVPISRQLLQQNGPAVEQIVRSQIRELISVKMDQVILNGQGSGSEPQGILNTPGIGEVTYGGATSWDSVLLSEKSLGDSNADVGNKLGWAISTATRRRWKNIPRIANGSVMIMEGGRVNDYPALATTQLSNNDQSVFGRWDDLFILIWSDGMQFTIDRVTNFSSVIVTVDLFFNLLVRHPNSFCCSVDSAAQ